MVDHYLSPDEEMALVDHLKGMSLASGAARELKSLLACLVMLGKEDIARKLQRVGENFQLSQKAMVKLTEDAMACDIVDEHVFVLELDIKKLRNESEEEQDKWVKSRPIMGRGPFGLQTGLELDLDLDFDLDLGKV
ncbi:hypothetical protein Tco_0898735 [Tanacetum coccineum]